VLPSNRLPKLLVGNMVAKLLQSNMVAKLLVGNMVAKLLQSNMVAKLLVGKQRTDQHCRRLAVQRVTIRVHFGSLRIIGHRVAPAGPIRPTGHLAAVAKIPGLRGRREVRR
jgi:hypothetical protein